MCEGKFSNIRLWTIDLHGLEVPPPYWRELLDSNERNQSDRFVRAEDRLSYTAAHALLRKALSLTIDAPAGLLHFSRDGRGKPYLDMPCFKGITFSLSHTTGMVAVAVGKELSIGVDVEKLDRKAILEHDLAAFGLSREEIDELASMTEPARTGAFFNLWTAREAVAKADGRGLALSLSSIRIDRRTGSASIHEVGTPAPASRWSLWQVQPSEQHCLTAAWEYGQGKLIAMDSGILLTQP
ncbi:MAG: 4'-phosphopantetheinyl transferase superfamily protein [Chlorobiaceae bacterium]|nr:4'-phosphopantetheinyl transferase superfamily protein [Chlorobiaceae bacterium]